MSQQCFRELKGSGKKKKVLIGCCIEPEMSLSFRQNATTNMHLQNHDARLSLVYVWVELPACGQAHAIAL